MSHPDSVPNPYDSPADVGVALAQSSEMGKLIYRTIKYAGIVVLVLFALRIFNILGFTYRYRVDNEPLQNPVRVVRNANEELELADGRLVAGFWENERLAELMKRTGTNHVELLPSDVGPDKVDIVAKDFQFICGIGDPMFTIPLIPMQVPRYKRVTIGYGDFVPRGSQSSATSAP